MSKRRRSAFQKPKHRCTHITSDVHLVNGRPDKPGYFRCVHAKGHIGPHIDVYFRVMSDKRITPNGPPRFT